MLQVLRVKGDRADIAKVVKSLVTFIRSPTWITSGFAQSHAGPGGANFACKFLFFLWGGGLLLFHGP